MTHSITNETRDELISLQDELVSICDCNIVMARNIRKLFKERYGL